MPSLFTANCESGEILMTSKHIEQNIQKFISDITESCLITTHFVNTLLEQWLANQCPSFETAETKRRREQDFQVAREIFIEREIEFEQLWHKYREEMLEDFIFEKECEERFAREKIYYQQAAVNLYHINDKIFRDEKNNLSKKIYFSIQFLSAQLTEFEKILDELSQQEKLLDEAMQTQLDNIDHEYREIFAGAHKVLKYNFSDSENTLEISTAILCKIFKETIPKKLRHRHIFPHQILRTEHDLIEKYVAEKIKAHLQNHNPDLIAHDADHYISTLISSPRFVKVQDDIFARVQAKKNENPAAHIALQTNLSLLSTQQQDHLNLGAAKDCTSSLKERLLKQRECLLKIQEQGLKTSEDMQHASNQIISTEEQQKVIEHQKRLADVVNYIKQDNECAKKIADKKPCMLAQTQPFFQPANSARGEGVFVTTMSAIELLAKKKS
jgi:hypothetical protein